MSKPSTIWLIYYEGRFIPFFLILFLKSASGRGCRFAPLSFHPWSWWDVRRGRDCLSAEFSSSVHQYFLAAAILPPSLHCSAALAHQWGLQKVQSPPYQSINVNHMNGSSWGEFSFLAQGNYYLAADPQVFAGGYLQLSNPKTSFNLTSNVLLCLKY